MILAIVVGLLLHCAAFATADVTTRRSQATELTARSSSDAALAIPGKRAPDLGKGDRILRLTMTPQTSATRVAAVRRSAEPRHAIQAPLVRARSHTLRLRSSRADDPPQPSFPS